jgi:hypothetical protein
MIETTVDDERRARGIPRTRETPCAVDDCNVVDYLVRVNPKGEPGIFMCARHARIVG